MLHLKLAGAFIIMGYIFTHKLWLNWLGSLPVELGLLVKQVIIVFLIWNLHLLDPAIAIFKKHTIGIYLIYLAFQIILNYQSRWIKESGSEAVEEQTPDGVLYHNTRHLVSDPEKARILTFVVAPTLLVLIGGLLIRSGQKAALD